MIFVERMLPLARERLVTIRDDASLTQAADLLDERHTNIVVVCDKTGAMVGIITKSDVVHQIGHCSGSACEAAVAKVMTRHVTYCRPGDLLDDVWSVMKERGLQQIPVVDGREPIGVINARDALLMLLEGSEHEESLLRDYVMGIGYR